MELPGQISNIDNNMPVEIKIEITDSDNLPDVLSDDQDKKAIETCYTENNSKRFDCIVETLKMEVTCEGEETQYTKENNFSYQCHDKKIKEKHCFIYSSDDDIPLSQFLTQKDININLLIDEQSDSIKHEIFNATSYNIPKKDSILPSKSKRKDIRRINREKQLAKTLRCAKLAEKKNKLQRKKKVYQYKKGKKVFCKSDSESSDFEKYVYFDESKTKRKIKIPSDIPIEDLEKEILDIKMENICLMKEHARINLIKLRERLQLRLEIKRLKSIFLELKIEEYLKNQLTLQTGTTAGLIEILKEHLDSADYSKLSIDKEHELHQKLETVKFTDSDFWKVFNNIETNTDGISPNSFWVGNLDTIQPNVKKYYKPENNEENLTDFDTVAFKVNNYPYADFTWNEKTSKNDDFKNTQNVCVKLDPGDDVESEMVQNSNFSAAEIHDDDWSSITAKNRIKTDYALETDVKKSVIDLQIDIKKIDPVTDIEEHAVEDTISYWQDEQTCIDSSDSHDNDDHTNATALKKAELIQRQNKIAETIKASKVAEEGGICSECGFDSAWSSFIARHRDAYQNAVKLAACHTCNMRFLKSGHFDGRHRLKRPPPKKFRSRLFMCDTCGQGCTSRSGLAQHVLKHKEAKYPCPHCPYKCRRKAYIKIHIETHNKTKQKQSDCHEKTMNQEIVSERQPQKTVSILNEQNSINDQELLKPISYNCDECTHVSLNPKALVKHKSSIHGFKAYSCDQCYYSTSKQSTLTQHARIHAKEKPFQCSHCDYKSSCKSYLKSHERYHTGVKPFQCDICDYSCVTATRMKVHHRKHTGEKPHCCIACDYKCSTNHGLKVHMKTHIVEEKVGV